MDDSAVVEAQIGRALRAPVDVAARCAEGFPLVIRVPPLLDDGTPFPTRYWLTCPTAHRAVSRLEESGLVRRFQARRDADSAFAAACRRADEAYAAERDAAVPSGHVGHRPQGGIGGSRSGVKCLHAHLAHHLAGGDNPIGAEVAAMIGGLDCRRPCVGSAP